MCGAAHHRNLQVALAASEPESQSLCSALLCFSSLGPHAALTPACATQGGSIAGRWRAACAPSSNCRIHTELANYRRPETSVLFFPPRDNRKRIAMTICPIPRRVVLEGVKVCGLMATHAAHTSTGPRLRQGLEISRNGRPGCGVGGLIRWIVVGSCFETTV
jgi:hypothetical protein